MSESKDTLNGGRTNDEQPRSAAVAAQLDHAALNRQRAVGKPPEIAADYKEGARAYAERAREVNGMGGIERVAVRNAAARGEDRQAGYAAERQARVAAYWADKIANAPEPPRAAQTEARRAGMRA